VFSSHGVTKQWCKAQAVNAAMRNVTTEIVAVMDADVMMSAGALELAVEALDDRQWAIPHWMVYRLDRTSTNALMTIDPTQATHPAHGLAHTFEEYPYPGHPGGGSVVLRRTDYHRVPLDTRFVGWGHEDDAWALALGVLLGPPWRGKAPMYHLYHPPQKRPARAYGSQQSQDIYAEYRARRRDPMLLRQWVELA
jgi:hypothetical protein